MALPIKPVIFVIVTAAMCFWSRASLFRPRSHGFYRLFAWIAILLLVLANIEHWFANPFRIAQLISWFLLIVSGVLVLCGVRQLKVVGKVDPSRKDKSLFSIEKTTELVTSGVYGYIRHPLYSSLLFLTWGVFLKHPTWISLIFASISTGLLIITAKIEEVENIRYFGDDYRKYKQHNRMFIPFVW